MEILGIGASELAFILLIAIIVLGPRDMQKAGKTVGRWLNQLVHSDSWKALQRASKEIRDLPTNLMREANMELQDVDKEIKEIRQTIDPRYRPPAPPASRNPSHRDAAQSPQPPTAKPTENDSDKND
jgi:sec-independent protein translocase protein TatB